MDLRVIEFVPTGVEVIAGARGYFAEQGVTPIVTRTRSALEQRQRIMVDEFDVALTAIDNLIAWDAQGDDLRLLAQVERTTILDLIARNEIASVEQLRGERLAVDAVDSGFSILLRKLLLDLGIRPDEYDLVPVGGLKERFDSITAGTTAAGLIGPPWSGKAVALGSRHLLTAHESLPDLPGIGLVARASRIDDVSDAIDAYIRALRQAAQWGQAATPEELIDTLTAGGFDLDGARQVAAVRPTSLEPSRVGLELLYAIRQELDLSPENSPTADELLWTWNGLQTPGG